MRALLQRSLQASVSVHGTEVGHIDQGLLVFLGVTHSDTSDDVLWLARKMVRLRLFDDDEGVMNRSLLDVQGSILLVSQFTLYANARKGLRPSYSSAAPPQCAEPLYELMGKTLEDILKRPISYGQFGASMQVSLINDGPVTLLLESPGTLPSSASLPSS